MAKLSRWGRKSNPEEEGTSVDPSDDGNGDTRIVGATLTVISGQEAGHVIYVGEGGGILGRGDEAEFVFADTTISRAHASLRLHGGDFYIKDLGSSNGTFVDGEQVTARVKLPPACRVRVGRETVLQFAALDELGREREYRRMLIEERLRWEKDRSMELERQAIELRRANEDLETFAFAASHDLQEPLRMVTSYLRLLVDRYEGEFDEDAGLFVGFALDGAERMKELLDDLLTYCRLGRDGTSLDAVDLGSVVDQAMANLSVAMEESQAEVSRDRLPVVTGNRSQLLQLLQNLLSNGIKFHSADPPKVHVGIEGEEDEEWVFYVRDNGIGMRSEDTGRIFQIFQRLNGRDEYPGTGIGLTLAKKIIEQHDGKLWLESAPGRGTTFYFTLPMGHTALADLTQTIL